jgi:hypothetical protein
MTAMMPASQLQRWRHHLNNSDGAFISIKRTLPCGPSSRSVYVTASLRP